jgi:FkbM family methyltransferase
VVVRRRLPAAHGGHALYVSPDASLRFWRRDLATADPLLLALCSELVTPGAHVWDIGANVGLFSTAAAFRVGRGGSVLAVEADPWLASLLVRSVANLPTEHGRVEVLNAAVTDQVGGAEFSIANRARAASHLTAVRGSSQAGGSRRIVTVDALTLDHLLGSRPTPQLVKIDTEGAELLCLQGGTRLLSLARPTILVEVSEENGRDLGELLHGHGYSLFDASLPAHERRELRRPSWNTLARPAQAPPASVGGSRP